MEINDALGEACQLANGFFSYQMVIIVAIAFFTILFNLYYLLDMLIRHSQNQVDIDTLFILYFTAQFIYYVVITFLLVDGSTNVTAEVRDVLFEVVLLLSFL